MDDLIAFITARLDEDEAAARYATTPPWTNSTPSPFVGADGHGIIAQAREGGDAEHIARHDPARALREVAAKRAILVDHGAQRDGTAVGCSRCSWDHYVIEDEPNGCPTLRALAGIWSDHADYRQEWAL